VSQLEGTHFTLALLSCVDESAPSRTDSGTARATLAAEGTLGTVRDDVAREDVKRYVEVRDAHRYNPYVMPSDHEPREWYDEAESVRQGRLRRWQTIR
jgi:ethanolamine ammonia-lyase small subunit